MLKEYFSDSKYSELKSSNNDIYKALEIVNVLFKDIKDKGGNPYILHLLYVYSNVSSEIEKVVALLHDTMEDKNISYQELLDIGFSKEICDDVKLLTRDKDISYDDYIDNLIKNGNSVVFNVKKADLENNMDISRIKNPSNEDLLRIENKYKPVYEKIINKIKEN